ncbi:MAG: TIGR01459 family HAD-type hydrolase [Hyphomicrobiales bacterium]|nr:TIGR01459 family HAD-type hydrolase [Hyphomicrobiales bacterium]
MTAPLPAIPLIPSVSVLASRYDAWLCDIWGVMHNGLQAFSSASEACCRFRENGGTVVLLSNSPRPRRGVIEQLETIGVSADAWDSVVTSGDVTRDLLNQNRHKTLFHLGPDRDRGVFTGLELTFADAGEAELVICSGLYDDTCETPDDYAGLLQELAARDVPMICANPDLMVERGSALIYCAGALAAEYEKFGGEVVYAGKPHTPIYDLAVSQIAEHRSEPVARKRIIAIGDGLKTDMAGAANAGLDALFIASGLHLAEAGSEGTVDAEAVVELFDGIADRPVAAQSRLSW